MGHEQSHFSEAGALTPVSLGRLECAVLCPSRVCSCSLVIILFVWFALLLSACAIMLVSLCYLVFWPTLHVTILFALSLWWCFRQKQWPNPFSIAILWNSIASTSNISTELIQWCMGEGVLYNFFFTELSFKNGIRGRHYILHHLIYSVFN